jgi:crossover junction endonuclease MUS81
MSLIIDNREKDLKCAFPSAIYKNMDLGDIQINYKNSDKPFILIERKTMSDLIASINDGRYREQKKRLLESGIPRDKLLYLLEGHSSDIPGHMKTLFGMIINTLYRDKIHILRLSNIDETIYFIKRILEKVENNDPKIIDCQINTNLEHDSNNKSEDNNTPVDVNLEYLSTIKLKKKDNLTSNNCSILQLAQIPGMSIQNAQIILNKYNSIANLINIYYQTDESKRNNMLTDIEISLTNGKTRKLGKVLSDRIYTYLFNLETESK